MIPEINCPLMTQSEVSLHPRSAGENEKRKKKKERNTRKQSQRINYESCPSPAHLTGVIGASRVSRHARKRAILVRILLAEIRSRRTTHSDDRDRFFGSLVRGKLISFIRGGNGGERE